MKRIINGKRYDTKTAVCVERWCNGLGSGDFKHCDEYLYRTKNGNYFLYGEGGPMTIWSESNGNTSYGSSGILALNPSEVLQWLEDREIDIPEDCPELQSLVVNA